MQNAKMDASIYDFLTCQSQIVVSDLRVVKAGE